MKPPKIDHTQNSLLDPRISSFLNPKSPIKVLSDQIQWEYFEKEFEELYKSGVGYPPKPIRLMVGLLMLQHMYKLSDEEVVVRWSENPYWQYFCGYDYFQWQNPIDPSSLTRFRKRLGKTGVRKILKSTIQQGIEQRVIKKKDLKKVIVDTTVMEKNITHPIDSKLLNRARKKLVNLAKKHDVPLRQNYNKVGPEKALEASMAARGKRFKKMQKCNKKLKTILRAVVNDVGRKVKDQEDIKEKFKTLLEISQKLLQQTRSSKGKIYSIHEPDVYCVGKGKVKKPYEYGSKVSIVVTQKRGFVLTADALEQNKHDASTLEGSLKNAEKISNQNIEQVVADKGYRGHKVKDKKVYISGQKKGITKYMKRRIKNRSAIEARISHLKNSGKLDTNYLKGIEGDKINALLCAVGYNLRKIMTHNHLIIIKLLRVIFLAIFLLFGYHRTVHLTVRKATENKGDFFRKP